MADDSMMGSVAERTDNIINYSGALNTSEEFIENTVNVSGTLDGPSNPYSIVSSATKGLALSKLLVNNKTKFAASVPKSQDSSFDYSGMLNQGLH